MYTKKYDKIRKSKMRRISRYLFSLFMSLVVTRLYQMRARATLLRTNPSQFSSPRDDKALKSKEVWTFSYPKLDPTRFKPKPSRAERTPTQKKKRSC